MKPNQVTHLDIVPVPKPRMTRADKWKKRPATTRYWAFKDELNRLVRGRLEPVFEVTFYVPMPKSWSKKKRAAMLGQPHQVKPDIDNYLKALMDCLCDDDSYIYDAHPRKFWAETGAIELIEIPAVDFSMFIEASLKPDMRRKDAKDKTTLAGAADALAL